MESNKSESSFNLLCANNSKHYDVKYFPHHSKCSPCHSTLPTDRIDKTIGGGTYKLLIIRVYNKIGWFSFSRTKTKS